ncbi:MAG: molybdopterin molybdotransferase MoeA [Gaiellaceae bacterium]
MADLLTIDEALVRIRERAQQLPVETVTVANAAGRVLREPALARVDLPPFASSAMDGFAVRAAETPADLPVAFRIAAGNTALQPLPTGAAAGIATGAAAPDGADAVVPVERVVDRGDRVEILDAVVSGQHIRPQGGDVRAGDVVAEAGVQIGAAQIGALAAVGVAEIRCSARPRVVVLATGSELRPAGEPLVHGQIYESNRAMIAAVLRGAGADVEVLPVVADDEPAHRAALERGLEADVLVTSGGVSMGPHDLVRRVAADLGVEEVFWGVAIKPGKPLSFGVRGSTLVFGLPGNPVSSLVGSLVFVRPALLARQGVAGVDLGYQYGRAATALQRNPHRDEFVRARRLPDEDGVLLEPVSGQESHMIVRAATADALIHVARGDGEIVTGAPVRFLTLD